MEKKKIRCPRCGGEEIETREGSIIREGGILLIVDHRGGTPWCECKKCLAIFDSLNGKLAEELGH